MHIAVHKALSLSKVYKFALRCAIPQSRAHVHHGGLFKIILLDDFQENILTHQTVTIMDLNSSSTHPLKSCKASVSVSVQLQQPLMITRHF